MSKSLFLLFIFNIYIYEKTYKRKFLKKKKKKKERRKEREGERRKRVIEEK